MWNLEKSQRISVCHEVWEGKRKNFTLQERPGKWREELSIYWIIGYLFCITVCCTTETDGFCLWFYFELELLDAHIAFAL